MYALINAAFDRNRTAMLLFLFILLSGLSAYISIPKESEPDVVIPIIYVSMGHEGISPEDAERLLVKPMEKELQSLAGLKVLKGSASEGHGSVLMEFDAGFDSEQALADVRERVDSVRSELPADSDEPKVEEINVALFPVLTITLSGPLPERTLLRLARELRDQIEALPGVLEVDIGGDRIEMMEIIVEPTVMESYQLRFDELFGLIRNNNLLIAAGALDTGAGRMVVKVPGVVEELEDVLSMPVKVNGDRVVTFADVASVRRTFMDPEGYARVGGNPAISLEVKKRIGANIIETIDEVHAIVAQQRLQWPDSLYVGFLQDKAKDVRTILSDLQNNVISAIVLVMIVIIAALGPRSALLVGLSIPGSFLAGILVLNAIGYTLNIVVLFSLILVVGMLVDGAIVVAELAERNLSSGMAPKDAYRAAAKRMSWPVAASTLTTLAVFTPLLFWEGVIGQFMKYLPATVIITLGASLFMALVFVPVLGGMLGGGRAQIGGISTVASPSWLARRYLALLKVLLRFPAATLVAAMGVMIATYMLYGAYGRGVEFFPDVEPNFAQVQIHARGDLSIHEKDAVVREVERRILNMEELRVVYGRSFVSGASNNMAEDVIGVIQLEFVDWQRRRPADQILAQIRELTADIPGVIIEPRKQENGPGAGKPVQIELSAPDYSKLAPAAVQLRRLMGELGGFVDIEDSRPLPGVDWRLQVDREEAARFGADIALLGNAVRMVTNGIKLSSYRPDDSDDELDIRVRFPNHYRTLGQLELLRVPTDRGMVPVSNFIELLPAPKTGVIKRVDGQRVITVEADVAEGVLVDDQVSSLKLALEGAGWSQGVDITFKGEDEEQRNASSFLGNAFMTAIFLMVVILVTQFNSLYQTLLVISAIIFSTAGVLLGLLVTQQTFGIVMVGIGIIALAGIVVNNNIVLIDTYNRLREEGMNAFDAALKTGEQRLRPVFLTSVTTVLGLMPMVLSMNIDLIQREISFGAPSTQWWTQLSSAIAGGLSFATVLTLMLTPCLLVLGERLRPSKVATLLSEPSIGL